MVEFRVGDQVILASGGNVMTVVGIDGGRVVCTWNDATGHGERTYPKEALKKKEETSGDGGNQGPGGRSAGKLKINPLKI